MRRLPLLLLALLLWTVPATLHAQGGGTWDGGAGGGGGRGHHRGAGERGAGADSARRAAEPDFLGVLLMRRNEIGLDDAQFTRISQIRYQLAEANRPLEARLAEVRSDSEPMDLAHMTDSARVALRDHFRAIGDLEAQIHDNEVTARQHALELLTPEQQKKADRAEDEARADARAGVTGPPGR